MLPKMSKLWHEFGGTCQKWAKFCNFGNFWAQILNTLKTILKGVNNANMEVSTNRFLLLMLIFPLKNS